MADSRVTVNLTAETTVYRLRLMAASIGDMAMRRVCREAAAAWETGDRGPLLAAVVALVDDVTAEAFAEVNARREAGRG